MVDSLGVSLERFPGAIQLSIVVEVVDTDFEAMCVQEGAQRGPDLIFTFRNEVERRPETQPDFHLGQAVASIQAPRAFDVMGEHEREPFFIRPAGPRLGGPA